MGSRANVIDLLGALVVVLAAACGTPEPAAGALASASSATAEPVAAAPAADEPAASAAGRSFTISGFGSYQRYKMSDVNRVMQEALATYAGSRADKSEIDAGAGFGVGIRIWPGERFFLSMEFQRLLASNSGTGQYAGSAYAVGLEVPASSVAMGVGYVLTPRSRLRLGLTGGLGYYMTTGDVAIVGSGVDYKADLEGSGFGVHGLGLVLARVTGGVHLDVEAGYRYAKTTDVTALGSRYLNSDGSLSKIDWSGVVGRVGVTYVVSGN